MRSLREFSTTDLQHLLETPNYRRLTPTEEKFLLEDDPYLSRSPWKALVLRVPLGKEAPLGRADLLLELLWLQDLLLIRRLPGRELSEQVREDFRRLVSDDEQDAALRLADAFVCEALTPLLVIWSMASEWERDYIGRNAYLWGIDEACLPDRSDYRWSFGGGREALVFPPDTTPPYMVWLFAYLCDNPEEDDRPPVSDTSRRKYLSLAIRWLMEEHDLLREYDISPESDFAWAEAERWELPLEPVFLSRVRKRHAQAKAGLEHGGGGKTPKERKKWTEWARVYVQVDPVEEFQKEWKESPQGRLQLARENPLEGTGYPLPQGFPVVKYPLPEDDEAAFPCAAWAHGLTHSPESDYETDTSLDSLPDELLESDWEDDTSDAIYPAGIFIDKERVPEWFVEQQPRLWDILQCLSQEPQKEGDPLNLFICKEGTHYFEYNKEVFIKPVRSLDPQPGIPYIQYNGGNRFNFNDTDGRHVEGTGNAFRSADIRRRASNEDASLSHVRNKVPVWYAILHADGLKTMGVGEEHSYKEFRDLALRLCTHSGQTWEAGMEAGFYDFFRCEEEWQKKHPGPFGKSIWLNQQLKRPADVLRYMAIVLAVRSRLSVLFD